MKRAFLLLFALASTASARTLLDTRLLRVPPNFSAATTKQVTRDLKRWPGSKVCADASVQDMATGFFTQKGVRETVYLIQDCPGNTDSNDWRMALYRNSKLQQVLTNAGQAIGNVGDLNGDGLDDLVFLGFKGEVTDFTEHQGATFFTLAAGKFRRLLDLDEVLSVDCQPEQGATNNVLAYRVSIGATGPRPLYTIEQFQNRYDDCTPGTAASYTLVKKWIQRGK